MKNIKTTCWNLTEANQHLQQDFSAVYWAFLIAQVNYKEVSFDSATQAIVFPEYIPLKSLLKDVLDNIKQGIIAVRQCRVCQQYFDVNKQDGIFGDNENLERFICKDCAQTLSAWDFYYQHLK